MESFKKENDSIQDNVDNNKEATIIKKIEDEVKGVVTYIVQQESGFKYILERIPDDDEFLNGDIKRLKKSSTQPSVHTPSIASIPSASSWRSDQKERFNIKFHSERSKNSTLETEFLSFFEKELPVDVPGDLKTLTSMNWYETQIEVEPIHAKLINQSHQFQLYQSEANTEEFVKTILGIFKIRPLPKVRLRFGVADLVLTQMMEEGLPFMYCVFEMKGAAPYDIEYRDKCRTQLAAYMISMALENDHNLQLTNGSRFGSQRLFGVLHIGLTPIFYQADIGDNYIDSISAANSFENVPELAIKEYTPIQPYNDREFFNQQSRPILIKSFEALLSKKKNFERNLNKMKFPPTLSHFGFVIHLTDSTI